MISWTNNQTMQLFRTHKKILSSQKTSEKQQKTKSSHVLEPINSDIIKSTAKEPLKLVKSQPHLELILLATLQNENRRLKSPRFTRSGRQFSLKKKLTVNRKFLSPQRKNNFLVHEPVQSEPVQEQRPYKTQVIPPSDLVHEKMKNFADNPQKFLLNVEEDLSKVFKKSIQSIIRTAKVIPVKDWQIRDSTDLLDGFKGDQ